MYRIWYIGGALIALLIVYQGFLRYDYTVVNGNAVQRYDRLTGKTCGIPECLPPTPTPVPKPTIFDPVISYRYEQAIFDHQARLAVNMVKKTEFGQELMRSPDAKKYTWSCEWSDSVAGSLFALHDPSGDQPLTVTPEYIESLHNPSYRIKLVCFCDEAGAGYRWEVNENTNKITSVDDDPALARKYGLVPAN